MLAARAMLALLPLLGAAALPYSKHAGRYCRANHPSPGAPAESAAYYGNDTVDECRARCDAMLCSCFDVSAEAGQWPCRVALSSADLLRSTAGYEAYVSAAPALPSTLSVNFSAPGSRLPHFWRSCGWCPPDPHPAFPQYFAREDVWLNHALIAAVPHGGVQYVRIHYLLDLIGLAQGEGENATVFADGYLRGKAVDWTALDAALDQLQSLGLDPGFEIMGNPGNAGDRSDRLFTDFGDHAQVLAWRDLIAALAGRYVGRYGAAAVQRWRWESWNEPEGQCRRDLTVGIKCDLTSFLAYWDASAAGLAAAHPALSIGGTASDGDDSFLYALIAHCLNGTNAVTGRPGCGPHPPRFFNVHKKGDQSSQAVTDGELPQLVRARAATRGTPLEGVPWGNDEADPKVGWSHTYPWRADARYAAMVPKVIAQHLQELVQGRAVRYDVLSNDNGFLNYPDNAGSLFQQRTLTARWAMNNSAPRSFQLVRKPVLNVMALLARLGDTALPVRGAAPAALAELAALASAAPGEAAVLLYNSADSGGSGAVTNVTLQLAGLQLGSDAAGAVFLLSNAHGNAHQVWVQQGSPKFPNAVQFAALRAAQEIPILPGWPGPLPADGSVAVPLPQPGIALAHFCSRPATAPSAPTDVQLHRTQTSTPPETLVRWRHGSDSPERCLRTFVVSFDGQRVNAQDTIFTAFLHAHTGSNATGCYTVWAVDYWGRAGAPSAAACS